MTISSLIGERIARAIFACGDDPKSPAQRIQFMGGDYPDNEKPQGGFCEKALADFIGEEIAKMIREPTP